jgi:hypothetical protein
MARFLIAAVEKRSRHMVLFFVSKRRGLYDMP